MKTFLLQKFAAMAILALFFNLAATQTYAATPAAIGKSAEIECTTPDGRIELVTPETHDGSAALTMKDETLSCALQQGHTTFVIKLPSTTLLDRFTFVNENASAAGDLKISVSNFQLPAASAKWVDVDGSITFSRKRLFNLSMVGVEARYLRLSFNVESAGRIAASGVFGGQKLDRSIWHKAGNQQVALISSAPQPRREDPKLDFDFASQQAKGRIVYISSGSMAAAQKMIDQNKATGFRFSASDPRPTVVVQLAQNEKIHRVKAFYRLPFGGRVDVYLLNEMSRNAAEIDQEKPVASATGETTESETAVEFDPAGARYVALRFSAGDAKDSASNGNPGQEIEVAEIGVFGVTPFAGENTEEAPDVYASNTAGTQFSATQFSGTGSREISNTLGTLAIPPTLPEVSP